jgi:hypothetical protein
MGLLSCAVVTSLKIYSNSFETKVLMIGKFSLVETVNCNLTVPKVHGIGVSKGSISIHRV